MSKKKQGKTRRQLREEDEGVPQLAAISREDYEAELHLLQIEFVKLQRHVIRKGSQILVLLEGRDAAGKDGSIKRIVEHLSPRDTRVVALGKPSDRDQRRWYFRRYVSQLPEAGEIVLFNRSWYNRAGVERVMGFCSARECEQFLSLVPQFEDLLVNSGVILLKYYLDISKGDQKERLRDRSRDPLKQWKTSAIDEVAIKHWDAYCTARDEMLLRTHTEAAPWHIIHADNKLLARLNLMRHVLSRLSYAGKKQVLTRPDPEIAFEFGPDCLASGRLAA